MKSGSAVPKAFLWRRIHSVAGIWLVIFLIGHLLTNSQAALFLGDDGQGFIHSVNSIHELPYLPIIEILLLGMPIVIHALWGIYYLKTGELNSYRTDGSRPALPQYERNRAYSWQRITSWILVVLVVAHVIHMRFWEYPASAKMSTQTSYMVRLGEDAGLRTLAPRLGVDILDANQVDRYVRDIDSESIQLTPVLKQEMEEKKRFADALTKRNLEEGQVIAVAKDFGTAELLMVRETFKMPIMLVLYTLLVLSAVYHAFNGFWTFFITWGMTMTESSQRLFLIVSKGLMYIVMFLGLAAVWGTYWINLKH